MGCVWVVSSPYLTHVSSTTVEFPNYGHEGYPKKSSVSYTYSQATTFKPPSFDFLTTKNVFFFRMAFPVFAYPREMLLSCHLVAGDGDGVRGPMSCLSPPPELRNAIRFDVQSHSRHWARPLPLWIHTRSRWIIALHTSSWTWQVHIGHCSENNTWKNTIVRWVGLRIAKKTLKLFWGIIASMVVASSEEKQEE
jgi:hypothetical protein